MNLKAFHLFFIALSIGLALWFGLWAWQTYALRGDPWMLLLSALSLTGAGLLVIYVVRFWHKAKRLD